MSKLTDALGMPGVSAQTLGNMVHRWLGTKRRLSRREAAFGLGAFLFAASLILLAFMPSPHGDARLFSDGWGAESFVEGDACSPGEAAAISLMPRPPVQATAMDRAALSLRYLAWGVLMPMLAATVLASRRVWARRPGVVIALLYGVLPSYFQWAANPAFVALRQALADFWLQRWPMEESQFVWLDLIAVTVWHGAGLVVGLTVWALAAAAAALAGAERLRVARALVPLGITLLMLGLTEALASYLRGEGVALELLPALRATALAVGAAWTAVAGASAMLPAIARMRSYAAIGLWSLPIALALAHGWWMYFEWTGRYRV